MKASVDYVKSKFDEYNKLMFESKLPRPSIMLSSAKTFLGKCEFKKRRLPDGRVERYNFCLRINSRFDLTEQELEDTIIHEMIHYYIGIFQLNDTSAHGQIFRKMMNTINNQYGRHISISHKMTDGQREEAYDKRRRWHVVAVLEFSDGRTGIKVLPRVLPRILNYNNVMGTDRRVTGIKLYMSDNIFFNRYPNSSALNAIIVEKDIVMEHLSGARIIQCDGKQVKVTKG